jgi:tetratricopeptide (TPR) repeat protein
VDGSASPAGLSRERVDAWCERGLLGLVLAVLAWGPLALGGVRPSEFLVLQFLTVAILLVWLVRLWFGKTHRLLWAPLCWAVTAFVGYAVWRYSRADLEYVARQELVRVLLYAVLLLAILTNLHRQQNTRLLALFLVGLGTLLSLYALYQWCTESEHVWHFLKPRVYFKRASGPYICPDHLAGYLGMLLPVALSFTLTGRFKTVPRILLGYASLMMAVGILVTVSYGGWLAAAVGLMAFFVAILRQRSYRLVGWLSLLLLLAGATFFYSHSLRSHAWLARTQVEHPERVPWMGIWPAAWRMWQDHFWTGVGPGHFDYRYRAYREASPLLQSRPGRVHNDYLNTLVDWGVWGAGLVALAWLALYWGVFWAWKYVRRRPNDLTHKKSNKSAFVLGAAVGLLILLVFSFFNFNMQIPANAMLAVTLMALIAGHLRFASDRFWVTLRLPGQILATLVLGALLAGMAWEGWRTAREQWWLGRAERAQSAPAALQSLERAFAVEPKNGETAYALGELLRAQSQPPGPESKPLLEAARGWYERAFALNPYDGYSCLRLGMCEHFLDRPAQAEAWFQKALPLDPHGYFMLAHLGWHYFQVGQYEKARECLNQSLQLRSTDNPVAEFYLQKTEEKLREKSHSAGGAKTGV